LKESFWTKRAREKERKRERERERERESDAPVENALLKEVDRKEICSAGLTQSLFDKSTFLYLKRSRT
jgi:hypothetical protein